MRTEIRYGKADVTVYRTYATPLRGIARIPESSFEARDNTLLAARIDVDVLGDEFLAAYTEGDNRMVVATDTMKNFIWAKALEYEGCTLEGLCAFIGREFVAAWAQMSSLRVRATELPFHEISPVLFSRSRDDAGSAEVELARAGDRAEVRAARSGRVGMQLIKLTGSSFARFVRDDHTTLPEMLDRALYVHFGVWWRYSDLAHATGERLDRYVASEQVRDLCARTFDDFNSRSIQHLVHEMGRRLLARFPQLGEVEFEAENRLWDTARERDERVKVYTDPRGTYGRIGLVLRR